MQAKKHKILFVDDEPKILEGLQRMLLPMRRVWEMRFAGSGEEALSLLKREAFDIVVTDMRMPGMDGVQLLSEVRRQAPEVIRIILSGYSDQKMVMKSIPLAHQFLSKPCPPELLQSTISRALALGELLGDRSLRKLVSQASQLPSLPDLYLQIEEAIQSPDGSMDQIADIISQDVGMTAKVLHLANSAYFGLPQVISSPKEAVFYIGLKALEALVLVIHIFSQFRNITRFQPFLDRLMLHSQAVAGIAEDIAKQEGADKTVRGNASMAGLLHDCGKLTLADNFPDQYEQVLSRAEQERMPLWKAEAEMFGLHHGSVGAYLLGLWGLPSPIIEALAFHHEPRSCPQDCFNILTAVHVANVLEQEDADSTSQRSQVDEDYLAGLGLGGRLAEWRTLSGKNS